MTEGKTKSGIKFAVDERIKNDVRFLYKISKVQNTALADEERNGALFEVLDFVFGGTEGMEAFMDAVTSANDGVCSIDAMTAELTEIFEALNAKNS